MAIFFVTRFGRFFCGGYRRERVEYCRINGRFFRPYFCKASFLLGQILPRLPPTTNDTGICKRGMDFVLRILVPGKVKASYPHQIFEIYGSISSPTGSYY